MTVEILDSATIVNLDTQPILFPTNGEGGRGEFNNLTDYTTHTVAFGSATGNASRTSRFPVEARVKQVWLFTSGLDSSSSQTLTLDVNVSFSDSAYDGTSVALQSQIPESALTGAITTLASYTSANKLFGAALTVGASSAVKYTNITYSGVYTPALAQQPMWAVLGGTGAATAAIQLAGGGFAQQVNGQICAPGGYFDILCVTAHTATTAATGTIGTEVDFVI
jgi:hypothetical protein